MTTYFKETRFKFAEDVQEEVLDIARNRQEELIERNPAWRKILDTTPYNEIEEILGVKQAREIKRRKIMMLKMFGENKQINFRQLSLPKHLEESLIEQSSECFPKDEIIPIVQISTNGSMLYPHKGHFRKTSLFCLLEGSDEETRWYKETTPFDLIPEYRIPDMSKCEQATSTVLKKGVWTFFNHYEWHSVHTRNESIDFRVNLGIDFKTLDANTVMEMIKEYV